MVNNISAVILNYRHSQDTITCLQALMMARGGTEVDYYIVDNSPEVTVAKEFQRLFPKVHYLSSPNNLGFAAGNNQAIRRALDKGSQYLLIINPDVTVGRDFFQPLMKHFDDPKVGLVAPVIYHTQKDRKVYGLEGKVNWHLAKPEHRNLSTLKSFKPIVSEFVTFACVLISADTFKKAGLLDENYFMYFEDVDYCLTAGQAGKKIILDPGVSVAHHTSSSFKRPTQKLLLSFRSHLHFINKWLTANQRPIPYIYVFTLYPYLYLLWTYHSIKYKNV